MCSIRSVLIFSALLLLLTPAFSQQENRATADEYLQQAEEIMQATKALDDARGILVMAADMDTTYAKANYEAGQAHLATIQKDAASKYLMRVYRANPDYRFDLLYWIGRSYQYGLEFDKAIDFYKQYKQKLAAKPNYVGRDKTPLNEVDRRIYQCENGKRYVSNPRNFSITNIGREINSDFDDYGPVLNEAEDELVFTTRRKDSNLNQDVAEDNKPWEDIFIAYKKGDSWDFAKNIGEPVNTLTNNSTLALSADGKLLFVYTDESGNGDILVSERQADGSWSSPEALPGIINSSYIENALTISKDEKTIYFTSDRPGGYGGFDIYSAQSDGKGGWTRVKNLGPKVNTIYDEEGPFIDYDEVTLFFSSEGHNGMGGLDVYKTTLDPKSKEWSEPENLGFPINTPDHDVYFVASRDSKRAYYSSFREDGMGYQDIYLITVPEGLKNLQPVDSAQKQPVVVKKDTATTTPVVAKNNIEPVKEPVKEPEKPKEEPKKPEVKSDPPKKVIVPLHYVVRVVDSNGKQPLAAKVKLQGAKDNVIVKMTQQEPGVYDFAITSNTPKDYRLSVDVDGYVFQNQNLRIEAAGTEEKTLSRTIELTRISVGVTKVLRNIYFDFNKASFKTESYTELNKLEGMLRQNSSVKVEIGGHTDGVGNGNYNLFLSRKRAEAVKDYLTKKGIDPRRVTAVGYGKTRPLATNDDEDEGRELNRRVEFKVLQN